MTVTQPPSYTVVPAKGVSPGVAVCSEQETSAVSFMVTGDAAAAGASLPLKAEVAPAFCKFGTVNTVTTSEYLQDLSLRPLTEVS